MVGEGRDAWRRVYYVAVCGVQKVGEKFWCFLGGVGKVCGWYNFIYCYIFRSITTNTYTLCAHFCVRINIKIM